MKFTCSSCGQVHDGLADLVIAAPYYYYLVPEGERERRCLLTSDVCAIDDRDCFIRGCLDIPVTGAAGTTWGVWCSISRANVAKYCAVIDQEQQSHVGPFLGWFSVRLRGYPETLNLKVRAHLRDRRARPRFELQESEHPLSLDCRHGISAARLQRIYAANLHAT